MRLKFILLFIFLLLNLNYIYLFFKKHFKILKIINFLFSNFINYSFENKNNDNKKI